MRARPALAAVAGLLAAAALPATADASYTKTMTVPSDAMVPTIPIGASIEVRMGAYQDDATPRVGDIVVVHPPRAAVRSYDRLGQFCGDRHRRPGQMCARAKPGLAPVLYLKRIVGLPGDRLSLRHGRLVRNGHVVDEPYAAACHNRQWCRFPRTITVPRRRYYLMGDNRGGNLDSRVWGPVPRRALAGRVESWS